MRTGLFSYRRTLLLITLLLAGVAQAQQQVDIHGPAGSVAFGFKVIALPNGNIVVSDPNASVNGMTFVGAVYLYRPDGTLVSTLVGSSAGDSIGAGVGQARITVLANGNFVVPSPYWKNASASSAGAVTFGNANTGWGPGTVVIGVGNSLVGSKSDDLVGYHGVTALSDGNYVVASASWDNGSIANAGAVTWADGTAGVTGPVGAFNSIVGTATGDGIGGDGVTALSNGRYVIASSAWNGVRGAVTRVAGGGTVTGTVSASNSLVGTTAFDAVGARVFKLSNGNYVVASPSWSGGLGAATWVNAVTAQPLGAVSTSNSLVGTLTTDTIGSDGVTALSNGNYVVGSSGWNANRGAATWGNGSSGAIGTVDNNPSITGGAADDYVGYYAAVPLSNGSYVVNSPYWNGNRGAATWGNGATGTALTVSPLNSLVGNSANDGVGAQVVALSSGHYVVGSPDWNGKMGAATWGNGTNGNPKGAITALNSLVGSSANDAVGGNLLALANGNYVASTYAWNGKRGATTWGNGSTGTTGTVSAGNSLVGTTANDGVGSSVLALSNGNFAAINFAWNNAGFSSVGCFSWGSGRGFTKGAVSTANSIFGQLPNDSVGNGLAVAYGNGTYAVHSQSWSGDNTIPQRGAVTLSRGNMPFPGTINARNSVIGARVGGGGSMSFDYHQASDTLVVGRPGDTMVSLLRIDQLFRDDVEQR